MTCLSRFRAPLVALLVLALGAGTSSAQWFQGPNPPPTPPGNIPNPPQPQNPPVPLAPAAPAPQQQPAPQRPAAKETPPPANAPLRYSLNLAARYSAEGQNVTRALHWRIFVERPGAAQPLFMVSESQDASPTFSLPPGKYVVHVAYGLASFTRRVDVTENRRETLVVAAGGLRLQGRVADAAIAPAKLRFDVYEGNFLQRSDGKKKGAMRNERPPVVRGVVPGDLVLLPAGTYYVQSTYGEGNSTITADVRIEAGRLTDAIVHHRAAQITLRLVHAAGGEALANTSWSVLTPGGDSIKEFIGAFPSIVLADGEYVVVARHDGKTYQANFKVLAGRDREVEVLARADNQAQTPQQSQTKQ
ncbi:MAG: hypothetical protein IPK23_06580 [Rhizobiales bacterium]|nr:hypothetical protein [Hyphomicrobiales bacterium]